jgi:hypothetical protein
MSGRKQMAWEDDPYQLEPDMTLHLLELYFAHMHNAVYWLYPRHHFIRWAKTSPQKCQNERLVLYATLAAASVFASDGVAAFGKQCAIIAGDAVASQTGRFNVPVAQARMMLALYHFAKGNVDVSYDHVGSALRTMVYLRLNTEDGCVDDERARQNARLEFQFSSEQLAECKRRTFWSCFLMDRLSGSSTCQIKPEDIFVRLPCTEDMYELSTPSDAPYFPNENIDSASTLLTPASPLGPMAWLALVAGIWGDVIDFIFRAPHRPASTYRQQYDLFYEEARNRMQGWVSRLPINLQYSEQNLDQSIQQGYANAFLTMHSIYHMAHIKLNQCLRHAEMPDAVTRNIREAHSHAQKQLRMVGALSKAKREYFFEGKPADFICSVPIVGYATLSASDIVGAGGPESNVVSTLELIDGGVLCLRELATHWDCARDQLRVCTKRFYEIQNVVKSGHQKLESGAWLGKNWGMDSPIERDLKSEDDCIYGLGDSQRAIRMYFDALAEEEGGRRGSQRVLRIA